MVFGCLFASPVYAYLDGGTGSVIVQGLFAGIAGFLAIIKLYWQNLKSFVNRLRGKSTTSEVSASERDMQDQ